MYYKCVTCSHPMTRCPIAEDGYRVAKMQRMPYLYASFSATEPYNSWLFCGKRPAS